MNSILEMLNRQIEALFILKQSMDANFVAVCDFITSCAKSNRVIFVSGVGKSGLVGQKISATFASLGIKSFYLDPRDTLHGDYGRVSPQDVFLIISNSGEVDEIITLALNIKNDIISITSNPSSTLANLSKYVLVLPKAREYSDHIPAPTTSTVCTEVIGNLIGIKVANDLGYTIQQFKNNHKGGKLLGNML